MSLNFHPKPGAVLICDFTTGFKKPEMIKKRPIVVLSPRPRRKTQLCTVVPLSTTKPVPIEDYHHCLNSFSLPEILAQQETWAKCDMLATVALDRLERVYVGKNLNGKRLYVAHRVTSEDFKKLQQCVLVALGLA